jgi:saccharopepsin
VPIYVCLPFPSLPLLPALTKQCQESGLFFLTTNISLGTPPQNFSVILSLFSRDLFVLSIMSPEAEFENHTHYDNTLSSTYTANSTRVTIPFLNVLGTGLTSRDHVTLGGVEVEDQLFAEVFRIKHGWSTNGVYYDGILGLGAKHGNSTMGAENIVTAMYRQGLIPSNLFSLSIPYNEGDVGELILGGMSDDIVEENVKWIPVSNKTFTIFDNDVRSSWQIAASSITVGDGTLVNNTLLPNATAWIETEMPFLFLPGKMVDEIHTLIGARGIGWSPFFSVPMERDEFPDIVFSFGGTDGDGEEVRITGYDYTICDDRSCMSMLMGMSGGDLITLGGGFLRGVRNVFDLEGNRVGCKFFPHFLF